MIQDSDTNFLYLADSLSKKYPTFFQRFEEVLKNNNIAFELLTNTLDVWAVDYMPIQIDVNKFIQFVYNPDYLRESKKWSNTISDVDNICNTLNISPIKSNILLDGGNVVRTSDTVIMCDKVFTENPMIKESDLIEELENLFEVDKLIFIPTAKDDITGHADGMVRFYSNDTVLINDFSKEDIDFQLRYRLSLHNAGLKYIEIAYNPYNNQKHDDARGIYINFLQMEQDIIIPTFGIKEDEPVIRQFEDLYKDQIITTIESSDLASGGGILNCITWNIKR